MRRFKITLLLLLLSINLYIPIAYSQILNKDGTIDCTSPTEITITSDTTIITSSGDYDYYKHSANQVIFYKESDKYTFWYKLIIQGDCRLTFDIFPTDPNDIYNFFLYKYEGDNFCHGIINKNILPVRANLFRNKINMTGTGLTSTPSTRDGLRDEQGQYNDAETLRTDGISYFYHSSHHEFIDTKAGDVYYLNIYHTLGDDCGHFFYLKACSGPAKIQATHKPCFIPPDGDMSAYMAISEERPSEESIPDFIERKPIERPIETKLPEKEIMTAIETAVINEEEKLAQKSSHIASEPSRTNSHFDEVKDSDCEFYTITGFITEEKRGFPLDADVKIVEEDTKKEIRVEVSPKTGEYTAKLKKHMNHKLIFSALGYIEDSLIIEYNPAIDLRGGGESSTRYLPDQDGFNIKLQNVNSGENIVLNNIYFHPNTSVFRTKSDVELERLFNFIKINDHAVIEIQGYTNGDYYIKKRKQYAHLGDEWNFQGTAKKLSKCRAEVVKKYLVEKGINEERIITRGFGGERMIIPDPVSYVESLKNMRVEILILNI
ncbi:MAG: OmpA family protein [Bacteroidota bacterium]